jgi:hypothetical protein
MQEITPENIESLIQSCDDADLLKELIGFAMRFEREDLVERIVEKSILQHRLVEKLQDFQIAPMLFDFND